MGKSDPFPKKQKNPSAKTKDKYLTEFYIRQKKDKSRSTNDPPHPTKAQFDYLKNNLHIKFCICGSRELLKFQTAKLSFRNYTPKILDQEINMGMWM
ncbi:hypothetical protein BDFB_013496 [Asbolus verrucosus]|uniref:Uncharacterized protein n=1 Tax=Asbolus verrucosus TaxID=1661398 RepID=A0A482VRG5_ASBVE|nr:hypothetical protein BDFB_013496 [Asbolus verrucosus]